MHDLATMNRHLHDAIACVDGAVVAAGPHAMQRGFADAIEGAAGAHLQAALRAIPGLRTAPARSRRSIEDFSITGDDGHTLRVDIKTHDIDGTFSMPNLVSIQRLWRILENPIEDLVFVFIDYAITDPAEGTARLAMPTCIPARDLSPDQLQIQNLGLGQLQLRQNACAAALRAAPGAPTLESSLPEMAVAFHERQIEKTRHEIEVWQSRTRQQARLFPSAEPARPTP